MWLYRKNPDTGKQVFVDDDELQIKEITMASGKLIPEEFIDKIKQVSDEITVDHSWQQGDVVMVDNIRFMHGSQAFEIGDP